MSSPQMTRMFGFLSAACADTTPSTATVNASAVTPSRRAQPGYRVVCLIGLSVLFGCPPQLISRAPADQARIKFCVWLFSLLHNRRFPRAVEDLLLGPVGADVE